MPPPSPTPPRVAAAYQRHGPRLQGYFDAAQAESPPRYLFLRAFKSEGQLELWAPSRTAPHRGTLLRTYPILTQSGVLGPKRREGDRQVPEGLYTIDRLNPHSRYHLSLGLNYPTLHDLRHATPHAPGSDIFIHGGTDTQGCLPLGDDAIEELYLLALTTRAPIPTHIFPFRFDSPAALSHQRAAPPWLQGFWRTLSDHFWAFEHHRRLPLGPPLPRLTR